MSSYCEYINCACKYCEEGHCDFPIQGSGYPYDAPCFGYKKEEMSRELKPCPFCGGKAEQKETYKYVGLGKSIPQYYVKCGNSDCGLYVSTCNRDTKEEAVKIWNRRVTE